MGFISGLVGIGGEIFLSLWLYFMKGEVPKKIAVASSFFILVNSIAGLLGQMTNSIFEMNWMLVSVLMVLVALGGFFQ